MYFTDGLEKELPNEKEGSPVTTPYPNDQAQRISILDQIRGAALFAIFIVNIFGLALVNPANPTWLAYTLYGDPNSHIELGAQG